MRTIYLPTDTPRTARPFDVVLFLTLDDVIIQLDTRPTDIRRRWLLLRKRWYERHVPATFGREA